MSFHYVKPVSFSGFLFLESSAKENVEKNAATLIAPTRGDRVNFQAFALHSCTNSAILSRAIFILSVAVA